MTRMPDLDWPPLQRLLGRAVRTLAYAMSAAAGAWVISHPPYAVSAQSGSAGPVLLGMVTVMAGVAAMLAVLAHRWHVEWVAVWFLGGTFGSYAVLEWGLVISGQIARGATAAAVSVIALLLVARAVELWVFSLEVDMGRRQRASLTGTEDDAG